MARLALIVSDDDRVKAQAVERIRKQVRILEVEALTGHNVDRQQLILVDSVCSRTR